VPKSVVFLYILSSCFWGIWLILIACNPNFRETPSLVGKLIRSFVCRITKFSFIFSIILSSFLAGSALGCKIVHDSSFEMLWTFSLYMFAFALFSALSYFLDISNLTGKIERIISAVMGSLFIGFVLYVLYTVPGGDWTLKKKRQNTEHAGAANFPTFDTSGILAAEQPQMPEASRDA